MYEGLKKKLAEWAGIDIEVGAKEKYLDSVSEGRGKGYLGNETWETDCEEWRKDMFRKAETPNFPESLDACIKWLVPKLYRWSLSQKREDKVVVAVVSNGKRNRIETADTPALALCLAIEKLIDGGK